MSVKLKHNGQDYECVFIASTEDYNVCCQCGESREAHGKEDWAEMEGFYERNRPSGNYGLALGE